MAKRPITVFFTSAGEEELGTPLKFWTKKNPVLGLCINCKSIDDSGHYFQLIIEEASGGKSFDIEFNVHHHYIKGYVHAPAIKELGFKPKA